VHVSAAYDYLGRRVAKTVYGSPNVVTKYAYDGDHIIAEYDGSGTLRRKFIYGPGIDEPICLIEVADNNAVYYYHLDGLGSVVALSHVNRVLVERYTYDVFGRPTIRDANGTEIEDSAFGNPYRFTGRAWDAETALYYYRARYYDYATARFLQPDPIGYTDGLNLYAYAGNNPIGLVDPLGLCKENPFSWWDNLKITVGNAVGDAIGWWYEESGGEEMEEYYWGGSHVGTQYGESAQKWWAERYVKAETWYGKVGYWLGGVAASAWTPETWKESAALVPTAHLLSQVPYNTEVISRATPGADGATSQIVKTTSRFSGRTVEVVHRVINTTGEIIHEHVKYVRRFLPW